MLPPQKLPDIKKSQKSGWDIPLHRQLTLDSFRRAASYNPAEAINRERERELERKRQEAAELEKKYEDGKQKNVRAEADARQHNLKKKRKDELDFGSI